MSAWIVSKTHIDRMVATAIEWGEIQPEDGTTLGRTLWVENLKSVASRYPGDGSGERPGPIGLADEDIKTYEFTGEPRPLTPVEMLKAIRCLDYQSCEHDGWGESVAYKALEQLTDAALDRAGLTDDNYHNSPEYDKAPWGFDA